MISTSERRKVFLTAQWRHLVMLNYEVDPAVLAELLPAGCELDDWQGRTLVSMVGFRFLDTRVFGVAIPFHRDFDEVNLRFYVRREVAGELRRGVVFVKELVPRRLVAAVARWAYGERYVALPMRHSLRPSATDPADDRQHATEVSYEWRRRARWEGLHASFSGVPELPAPGSEEAFVTEHYWGYARRRDGDTVEYEVEHPRWRVWPAADSALLCDAATLYGSAFAAALAGEPASAFVAEGSEVVVRRGANLGAASAPACHDVSKEGS